MRILLLTEVVIATNQGQSVRSLVYFCDAFRDPVKLICGISFISEAVMKLSQNFKSEEFACRCGICPGAEDPPMDVGFIMKLQKMRNLYAKPIRITSGFRCPSHNRNIRGATESKHMKGIAADIFCISAGEKYWLVKYAIEVGFAGIGVGPDFVHVDTREGTAIIWTY
jgi:hypothetical protein